MESDYLGFGAKFKVNIPIKDREKCFFVERKAEEYRGVFLVFFILGYFPF